MQTSLIFITSETFKEVRKSIAINSEKEKDNYISFLLKRNAGLKGEITKMKKHDIHRFFGK